MKRAAWITTIVLMTVSGLVLLWQLKHVAGIFLFSLIVSATVRPPIEQLVRRRIPLGLAMLLTYAVTIGMLVLLFALVGASLVSELQQASDALAEAYDGLRQAWAVGEGWQQFLAGQMPPTEQLYEGIAGGQGIALAEAVLGYTVSLFQVITDASLVMVLSLYWGANRVHSERLWLSVLPATHRSRAREIWRAIEKGVGAYVRSEFVQSLLAGLLLGVGFWLLGLPYPVLLALIGAVLWLVPLLGGLLAIAPVLLVGFSVSQLLGGAAVLYTAAVFALLELVVEPRVFHRRRYNSILTVTMMIALANALGLLGLVLAPPIGAAFQILVREVTRPSAQREALPQLAELRERMTTVRRALEAEQPVPEVASLLDRLQGLLDEAGGMLAGTMPGQHQDGFASLAAAAGDAAGAVGPGRSPVSEAQSDA